MRQKTRLGKDFYQPCNQGETLHRKTVLDLPSNTVTTKQTKTLFFCLFWTELHKPLCLGAARMILQIHHWKKHPILRVCIHSVFVPYAKLIQISSASPSPHAASHLSYLEEWLWTKKNKICLYQVKSIFFQFQMEVSSLVGVMGHNHWHYNSIKRKEIISVSPSLDHRASYLFLLADLCNKAVSLEELNILRR